MEYSSARERSLKIKLHMKVCKNPPEEAEVRKPKVKSMTLKEVLQYSSDRNEKVYELYVANGNILRKEQRQSRTSANGIN